MSDTRCPILSYMMRLPNEHQSVGYNLIYNLSKFLHSAQDWSKHNAAKTWQYLVNKPLQAAGLLEGKN